LTDNVMGLNQPAVPPVLPESRQADPPRVGRWALAGLVIGAFIAVQIAVFLPVAFAIAAADPLMAQGEYQAALEAFLSSDEGLLLTVLAAALAGLTTVLMSFSWPWLWNRVSRGPRFNAGDWLAWRPPDRLPLWLVPLVTVPLLLTVAFGVTTVFGESQVDEQILLFSSPLLRVVSALVVSFIAPLAEEVVFRGALYNALLLPRAAHGRGWERHIVAFVVTSLVFAAMHFFAGFDRLGSILMITVFSLYLTALRAYTGSVQPSVVAHMVWNMIGSAALILANLTGATP